MKRIIQLSTFFLLCIVFNIQAQSSYSAVDIDQLASRYSQLESASEEHCEIPCGIYNDKMRVEFIKEHITTIEKSMNKINDLSSQEKPNYNQLVRWVVNKEDHANKIQEIVSQYFLHQRIKPADPKDKKAYQKYTMRLIQLHQISVLAMKAKQSTDLGVIESLNNMVHDFEVAYFEDHDHEHGHKH